jgi:putative NIF3 family GTP cyclohydrolase 1 type 2
MSDRSIIPHQRSAINPTSPPIASHPTAGQGRIVRFTDPQPLGELLARIQGSLGTQHGLPVAIPQGKKIKDIDISSVGICAGSGSGMLSGLKCVDLLFTGELSHHEALSAIENGQCVVSVFHSNSERGFLSDVLKEKLADEVKKQWSEIRKSDKEDKDTEEALDDESVSVEVSKADRDPYGIVHSLS